MYDLSKVAKRVKALRKMKGCTQEKVAEELGVHIRTYRGIEVGEKVGRIDTLCLIAEYFNVSVDYLIFRDRRIEEEYIMELNQLSKEQQKFVLELTKGVIQLLKVNFL